MAEIAPASGRLRERIYHVVFLSDSPAGKAFDVALIVAILMSVGVVMLDSVATVRSQIPELLSGAEWFFTLLFTRRVPPPALAHAEEPRVRH